MKRKGITPVVAVVLLIAIVVAGSFTVYKSVRSAQTQFVDQNPELPISADSVSFESCWGTPTDPNFSVRNSADKAINVSEIPVRVNRTYLDRPADYTLSQTIVNPKGTFTLDITNPPQPLNEETEVSLILDEETVSYSCRNLN